ncbi:PilZ domain-containing protein [Novosphingobium aerophilum]|uniref:PilZ domain-containing protein n=1 Tax=Novosphingobium TaxID=165696 RepID=UPI0006C8CE01|nr:MULTISPECIES: PilZ domain-containing protein [unclassified Novosphingobium]KPH62794.1 hypothetical protein ADT71_14340 [Novosphingobium sp. ST904]TCM39194.1 PilZ domain-containing protein [Novosphingobium sp. ST904]WRT92753.1 PilZ domain-containing protein [Novosphingobium sp. RL4]
MPNSSFALSPSAGAANPIVPRGPRVTTILLIGKLASENGETICRIRNISDNGLMAEVHGVYAAGQAVAITLKAGDVLRGEVRWSLNGRIGVEFGEVVHVSALLAHVANRMGPEGVARGPRFDVDCGAEVFARHQWHEARLQDLSQGGARLSCAAPMERDSLIALAVPGLGERKAAVRWVGEGAHGLSFLEPLSFAEFGPWLIDHRQRYRA